jgi:aldose 1-epimerase
VTVDLRAGDWAATLSPELGGAILTLRRGGTDVLRPTPSGTSAILDTACWPLVPYANRIAFGRFRTGERDIALPRNFGDHPHSLHGVGWQAAWQLADRTGASATLVHRHAGGVEWPWRYRAIQTLVLDHSGLTASLELDNEDNEPMPASLGFHPYFPADATTSLRFAAREMWQCDPDQLPTHAISGHLVDRWRTGAPALQPELIDHCHAGWSGEAFIEHHGHLTRLQTQGATFLHIHAPPGSRFVGVEPVTAMPDAVNRPEPANRTGLRILAGGETMTLSMRIECR